MALSSDKNPASNSDSRFWSQIRVLVLLLTSHLCDVKEVPEPLPAPVFHLGSGDMIICRENYMSD